MPNSVRLSKKTVAPQTYQVPTLVERVIKATNPHEVLQRDGISAESFLSVHGKALEARGAEGKRVKDTLTPPRPKPEWVTAHEKRLMERIAIPEPCTLKVCFKQMPQTKQEARKERRHEKPVRSHYVTVI